MERAEAEAVYDRGRERCVEFILELARGFERLTVECGRPEERVRRLEERSCQSSRTSSKPPSQDPPTTRQQRRAEARAKAKELLKGSVKREAGGQPGHQGSGRKLLGEDQVDEMVDHYREACDGCGREFSEAEKAPSRRPGRHQVADLPPIAVIYTEHRTHRLRCAGCRRQTSTVLGPRPPGRRSGPVFRRRSWR